MAKKHELQKNPQHVTNIYITHKNQKPGLKC